MASTASQLAILANDSQFQMRVRGVVLNVAATVYSETPATPDTRREFSKRLMSNPDQAQRLAVVIASLPALVAGTVTFDWDSNRPVTSVTDAGLVTAVTSAWNMLAGV
jgi:hypothetical protein